MRERSASEFNRDCWLVGDDGVSTDGCGARYDQVLVSHIGAISAWGLSAGLLTLGTVFAVIDRRARAPAAHAAPAWWITAGPTALGASVGGRF